MIKKIKDLISNYSSEDKVEESSALIKLNEACAALLVEIAFADKEFDLNEKESLKQSLIETYNLEADAIEEIIKDAEIKEQDSNQILEFTKEVKNKNIDEKKIVIEALWTIIYSDEEADMYETNLMRRLSGLLYLDSKVVGDIKEKVRSKQ